MNTFKIGDTQGIENVIEDPMEGLLRSQEAPAFSEEDPIFKLPSEAISLNSTNIPGDNISSLLNADASLGGIVGSEPFITGLNAFADQNFFSDLNVSVNTFYATQDVQWYYTDPQMQIQGPFSQENMRRWNEEGYFSSDLPIKISNWSKFYLFYEVFPDSKFAFVTTSLCRLTMKF